MNDDEFARGLISMTSTGGRGSKWKPAIELTVAEYEALSFAASMLRARAEQLDDGHMPSIARMVRRQAETLQRVYDRWHRARAVAEHGRPHERCGWCEGGAA